MNSENNHVESNDGANVINSSLGNEVKTDIKKPLEKKLTVEEALSYRTHEIDYRSAQYDESRNLTFSGFVTYSEQSNWNEISTSAMIGNNYAKYGMTNIIDGRVHLYTLYNGNTFREFCFDRNSKFPSHISYIAHDYFEELSGKIANEYGNKNLFKNERTRSSNIKSGIRTYVCNPGICAMGVQPFTGNYAFLCNINNYSIIRMTQRTSYETPVQDHDKTQTHTLYKDSHMALINSNVSCMTFIQNGSCVIGTEIYHPCHHKSTMTLYDPSLKSVQDTPLDGNIKQMLHSHNSVFGLKIIHVDQSCLIRYDHRESKYEEMSKLDGVSVNYGKSMCILPDNNILITSSDIIYRYDVKMKKVELIDNNLSDNQKLIYIVSDDFGNLYSMIKYENLFLDANQSILVKNPQHLLSSLKFSN